MKFFFVFLPKVLHVLTIIFRLIVGGLILHVGYTLIINPYKFGYYSDGNFVSGLFIMAIGCYCLLSSFSHSSFKNLKN